MLNHWRLQSRPSSAPIDLDDLKVHLRLFDDDSVTDDYLSALIATAVDIASNYLGRGVGDHEYEAYYTNFEETLTLPHDRVSSIASVQYYDVDNVLQTVSDSDYFFDDTGYSPCVTFEDSFEEPDIHEKRKAPVVITYDNELSSVETGPAVEQALLVICADLFVSKASNSSRAMSSAAVNTYQTLLFPYRRIPV